LVSMIFPYKHVSALARTLAGIKFEESAAVGTDATVQFAKHR
jgi:hypothetical protein